MNIFQFHTPKNILPLTLTGVRLRRSALRIVIGFVLVVAAIFYYMRPADLPEIEPLPGPVDDASFAAGLKAAEERRFMDAYQLLLPHAEGGNARAQDLVARTHMLGIDKYQMDFCQAVYWTDQAARNGLPTAQLRLSNMLAVGSGTYIDPSKSYFWFVQSRESIPRADLNIEYSQSEMDRYLTSRSKDYPHDVIEQAQSLYPVKSSNLAEAPPTPIVTLPDIPLIGSIYGLIWKKSRGCGSLAMKVNDFRKIELAPRLIGLRY